LRRAFTNLVENATYYTPAGQVVMVRTRQNEQKILVEITDTGIGIDEATLPYIFDRFYRSPEAKLLIRSGSGLGLAIVKRVIEMHRGWVEVESVMGKGTTFRVLLPTQEFSV
jgi:signal transduction histidine kinase